MVFMGFAKAQQLAAKYCKEARLKLGFTQEGLAKKSGLSVSTLRKFEQHGLISLESFLKLCMVLGLLEKFVKALEPQEENFRTIEDVIKSNKPKPERKRGWRK